MQKFPEFFELKARIEEKAKQIEDKDRHIEFLKKELESVGQREQDLKQMHSNYMMQMQTLINQKSIEAPGAKNHGGDFGNMSCSMKEDSIPLPHSDKY